MTTRDSMYSRDIASDTRRAISVLQEGVTKLPPELDEAGNVEYKVKDLLSEGDGHAVYVVGVSDNGEVVGISDEEMLHTVSTIKRMARQLDNASIVSVEKRRLGPSGRLVAEVRLAQKTPLPQTELRVAVLGDHGAGKSTVLGCLTYDEPDDGHGSARLSLMRHQHELESGRTSSITFSAIGFAADAQVQNYANNRSAEQIYQRSQHVVTFVDTCGHAKHLKTTARAITGCSPHMFCVVVAADAGKVTAATREYLQIATALDIPLLVVISKMDVAAKASFAALMRDLLDTLDTVLPARSKCIVNNIADYQSLADDTMSRGVVPIFTTSAVRTIGFSELTRVLGRSRTKRSGSGTFTNEPFEFHVEHLYSIDSVGTVVTGWVNSGAVAAGHASGPPLMVGPDSSGGFVEADITSIHTLRIPTETAKAGLSAALAIQPRAAIRIQKGMVVLSTDRLDTGSHRVSSEFSAVVTILSSGLAQMQAVVVHIRSTYHPATVVDVDSCPKAQMRNGGAQVTVRLRLSGGAREYVYPGMPIVVRDGCTLTFAGRVTVAM
ncbi:GTP binding protein [Coemansia sp. RSA 2711]|nr:GTP binding protein [Coemansia sp. RSA 2711]